MPSKPPMPLSKKKERKSLNAKGSNPHARAREREKFIQLFADSGNVADSLRKAGIPQRTAYGWKKSDPEFAALWKEAEEIATDGLVDEARRRGVEGWDEDVYQQGKRVGTIRRHSDRMLEILLKGHRPEKYRENPTTAVQVNVSTTQSPADRDSMILDTARGMALILQAGAEIERKRQVQALLPAPVESTTPGVERGVATSAAPVSPLSAADSISADEAARRHEEAEIARGDRLCEADVMRELRRRERPQARTRAFRRRG